MPFRTLSSRSSTVWLFTMKNLSFADDLSSWSALAASAFASASLTGDTLLVDTMGSDAGSAGVGTLAETPTEFLRSLLVNPTF